MMMRPIGPDPASEVTSIPNSPTNFSSPWRCPISPQVSGPPARRRPEAGSLSRPAWDTQAMSRPCHRRPPRDRQRNPEGHLLTRLGRSARTLCSGTSSPAAPERSQHLPADRRLDINGCLGCLQSHQDVPAVTAEPSVTFHSGTTASSPPFPVVGSGERRLPCSSTHE